MSQNSHLGRGADYLNGRMTSNNNNISGGSISREYDDHRYYNHPDTHNMVFQDLSSKNIGYHEMVGGGSSQIIEHLGGLTQSNSNSGSLAGSQSSIGSQSYQSHSFNSSASLSNSNPNPNPSSNPNPNSNPNSNPNPNLNLNSSSSSINHLSSHHSSHPSPSQFRQSGNSMQQVSQSIYQRQLQHPNTKLQSHSMPPSSSPSPPQSPTLQSCTSNDYTSRVGYTQSSQFLRPCASPSPHYSQSSSSQYSQSSQPSHNTTQLNQLTQPSQLTQHPQQVKFSHSSQMLTQPSYLSPSNTIRNFNIPMEKVVWDYLHLLYRQNTAALGYLAPYIDESFNIGKFHCMVTEFCKRQRISKDALIIYSKNWFKEYLDQRESQNVVITLEDEIKRYVMSKIKHYENLGFKLDSEKISQFYCNLVPFMIRSIWRRLENASYKRVDWSSREYLGSEVDPNFCNYAMINKIMRINNNQEDSNKDHTEITPTIKTTRTDNNDQETISKDKHQGSNSMVDFTSGNNLENDNNNDLGNNDNNDNDNDDDDHHHHHHYQAEDDLQVKGRSDPNELDEQTKEMVIVSRTQKWLLRNVKLEDFKYLIKMDQLKEEKNILRNNTRSKPRSKLKSNKNSYSNSITSFNLKNSIKLPKKTQNTILDYINFNNYKFN